MLDESHTRTLDRVRIPPELHATIWKLFSELKQDTIQQACLHASSRSTEEMLRSADGRRRRGYRVLPN